MRSALFAAPITLLATATICAAAFAASPLPAKGTLTLDPAHTRISFTLGGSLHSTEGTFQLKNGTISADPATGQASGEIVIDASSASTDESMRDAKMKDSVLETGRYPKIVFVPQKVAGHEDSNGNFTAKLSGVLRLHGAAHAITLDVTGRVVGDTLTATTSLIVPYVSWGLTDPSIMFLRVDKVVDIAIAASGHVTWLATAPAR